MEKKREPEHIVIKADDFLELAFAMKNIVAQKSARCKVEGIKFAILWQYEAFDISPEHKLAGICVYGDDGIKLYEKVRNIRKTFGMKVGDLPEEVRRFKQSQKKK